MPAADPDRDRRLARRPRYGFRRAEGMGSIVEDFLGSEEARRMKRFLRVAPALREILPARLLATVQPIRLHGGVLTLEVKDGLALHELRQHHAHAILESLASGGTGISRLAWKLASTHRPAG